MGQYVESQVARDVSTLLENSGPQLGSMFHDYQEKARATILNTLREERCRYPVPRGNGRHLQPCEVTRSGVPCHSVVPHG
ncbi:hypothetical protein GCM10009609_27980 [Pseudonocardia aurantiaca]